MSNEKSLDQQFIETLNLTHLGDLFADIKVSKNVKGEFVAVFPKEFYTVNKARCQKYIGGLMKAAVREKLSIRLAAGHLVITPKTGPAAWAAQENMSFYQS